MSRTAVFALAAAAIVLTPACAQEKVDTSDRAAVEQIVRDYILENPEIIEEALIALSQRDSAAEQAKARETILANADALFNNPADYSIGPDDAPVTVVEFFDYRCSYCKRSMPWATALPDAYDGKVRVVFKEFPILSPESEQASLAAIAAGKQGKYAEMHVELMKLDNKSGFGTEEIDAAGKRAGVDVTKMRADMKSMAVQKTVADAKSLARSIGVAGTPNFVVGDTLVPGADTDAVAALIDAELAKES